MDELLASIVRLQGDNVVRALQGMLQQAKVALKPGNKSSKSRLSQTTSPSVGQVDKKALACSIIALLQHSCTPAATAAVPAADSNLTDLENLSSSVSEALTEGMRQQPWLWERLVRQHLDYLLQTPGAVDLLTNSLSQLDSHVVSRSWAVLSTQLRHVDPLILCSAPALGNFQRAALSQVSSCFRFISRDVLPSSAGTAAAAGTLPASAAAASANAEVDVTLSMHLPAALYTLLYLVGVTDQQGAPSLWSDRGCVEGAAAYTSMLLTQLSSPESVYKMLQLDTLKQRIKSGTKKGTAVKNEKKSGAKEKERKEEKVKGNTNDNDDKDDDDEEHEGPKLSFENLSKIHAAMYTATVLIEALLTSPQLANSLLSSTTSTKVATCNESEKLPSASPLTRIAVLLSIRWELAQLLAAAGITPGSPFSKSFSKSAPPVWSQQTCAAIISAVVTSTLGFRQSPTAMGQQQQSTPALTLPPAMLAHGLELIQEALTADNSSDSVDTIEFLAQLLQHVMQVQEACATGVLNPHAAVHAGPGHHLALAAARKLHSLLLEEDTSTIEKNSNIDRGGDHIGSKSKRSGPAVPAESKRRKKGGAARGGGQETGQDAVADLMRMFTAGGSDQAPPGSNKKESTLSAAPPITIAAVAAAAETAIRPERKRITPQAIHVTKVSDPLLSGGNLISDIKNEDEEEEGEEEESDDGGKKNIGQGGGGTFGRVVMASTLDMDDATREAAWQAYISDKEKLVDMLGDSAYQEWYDEAEHPLSAGTNTNRNSNTVDTFFDAIFGGAGDAGQSDGPQGQGNNNNGGRDALFGSSLPQTILETSLLYPWQAALAASLQLALSILQIITERSTTISPFHSGHSTPADSAAASAVRMCCANLISVEQRKASAAAVLKIVDPTHSRNTWLAASKGAELFPASGSLLHLVYQLRVLLLRTSRRTSPPMLAAYLAMACFILDTAAVKEVAEGAAATTTNKISWQPLHYVGYIVKSVCCYPPLLAASFNRISAQALLKLASAGVYPVSESIAYAAGVLWLIVQTPNTAGQRNRAVRPEWLIEALPDARAHPLVAAAPFVKSAAAEELLQQLNGHTEEDKEEEKEGGGDQRSGMYDVISLVNSAMGTPISGANDVVNGVIGDLSCLMPLIDACAAAAFCLHCEEQEEESRAARDSPIGEKTVAQTVLLGHIKSMATLASLSSMLLNAFAASAEALATALDMSSTTTTATATTAATATASREESLLQIELRASLLGIGLEFTEVISLIAPSLQSAEISSRTVLPSVLERCTGVQGSCLELLRTLSEDSEIYLAAVRGLENAPVLALPPARTDDEEQNDHEDADEGGSQLFAGDSIDSDGGDDTNASDRPELTAYERRKRLKDIRNPYLRVIVAESRRAAGDAADGELSDLEDFIVANPERDYGGFIADHFPMAQESDEEEEWSEEEEEADD